MSALIDRARSIALEAHGGTINKHDGELYLLHVSRVSVGAREFSNQFETVPTYVAEATAWLHDVVEDCPEWPLSRIAKFFEANGDVGADIVRAVDLLTKKKGESNEEYYRKIASFDLARCVKLADMTDNFRRNHLITDEPTRLRMAAKYSLGMDILGTGGMR